MKLLDITDLSIAIRQRTGNAPVLRHVNLSIAQGQVCGLVGESGAGKSMVAKAILGLLPGSAVIHGGGIDFDGENLLTLARTAKQRLLGRHIALIPQDPMVSLNPVKPIGRQIGDGMVHHLGIDAKSAQSRALDLLAEVLIKDPERVLKAYAHELSGGMRQRVLIAMAFSCEPRLIIADEPTTALDVTVQKRVLSLIRALQRKRNTALLFVTHDLGVVAKICDRVAVMFNGRIIEEGSIGQLFNGDCHPYTAALFAATPRYDQPDKPVTPVARSLLQSLIRETEAGGSIG